MHRLGIALIPGCARATVMCTGLIRGCQGWCAVVFSAGALSTFSILIVGGFDIVAIIVVCTVTIAEKVKLVTDQAHTLRLRGGREQKSRKARPQTSTTYMSRLLHYLAFAHDVEERPATLPNYGPQHHQKCCHLVAHALRMNLRPVCCCVPLAVVWVGWGGGGGG